MVAVWLPTIVSGSAKYSTYDVHQLESNLKRNAEEKLCGTFMLNAGAGVAGLCDDAGALGYAVARAALQGLPSWQTLVGWETLLLHSGNVSQSIWPSETSECMIVFVPSFRLQRVLHEQELHPNQPYNLEIAIRTGAALG